MKINFDKVITADINLAKRIYKEGDIFKYKFTTVCTKYMTDEEESLKKLLYKSISIFKPKTAAIAYPKINDIWDIQMQRMFQDKGCRMIFYDHRTCTAFYKIENLPAYSE